MILHVASTAPAAVRLLADAALALHISGATTGLAAGTVAMVARKGGRLHRLSGNVFFFAMLAMSGIGAVVAPMIDDVGSAIAGAMTLYLVITGWRAGRTQAVKGGRFEKAGIAMLATGMATMLWFGYRRIVLHDPGMADVPTAAFFVIAGIAALLGALDLKVILGRPLVGPPRLARHIWRMGLSLFIALMSGLAQPKAGGLLFHGAAVNLQWIPVGALVLSLAYWLVRVRLGPLGGFWGARRKTRSAIRTAAQGVLS